MQTFANYFSKQLDDSEMFAISICNVMNVIVKTFCKKKVFYAHYILVSNVFEHLKLILI